MNRGESNCYTSTKLGTLPGRPAKNTGQLGGETLLALTPGKITQKTTIRNNMTKRQSLLALRFCFQQIFYSLQFVEHPQSTDQTDLKLASPATLSFLNPLTTTSLSSLSCKANPPLHFHLIFRFKCDWSPSVLDVVLGVEESNLECALGDRI